MGSGKHFDCCVIGQGKLTIECAQLLLNQGHTIRGVISANIDVRDWAEGQGIANIDSSADQEEFLDKWPFDYLFSIINPFKTPDNILRKPKLAAINYHDAPLPKYAGLYVTSWAVQNLEHSFGVTWHEMGSQFDAGDILKQAEFPVEQDETAFSLSIKCFQKGKETFAELIQELATGSVTRKSQDLSQRSVYLSSQRPKQEAIIDWNSTAEEICALSRGLNFQSDDNPLSIPKVLFNGTFYLADEEIVFGATNTSHEPGTIIKVDEKGIEVATNNNSVLLKSLSTLDGDSISLVDISGLSAGVIFPILSEEKASTTHQFNQQLAATEHFWQQLLLNAAPFTLASHGGRLTGKGDTKVQREPFTIREEMQRQISAAFPGQSFSFTLGALFCCFLRRLADMESFDIGMNVRTDKNLPDVDNLFASRVPLNLKLDSKQSIKVLLDDVIANFALLKEKGTYARDLISRTQGLGFVEFPVAIEFLKDLDQGCSGQSDTLVLALQEDTANYQWKYDSSLLNDDSAKQIIEKFDTFLKHAVAQPDKALSQVSLIGKEELQKILVDWNKTDKDISTDLCVHQLIEKQAEQNPDAIALVFRDEQITYAALNLQANSLASSLQALGAKPDALIGIFIERSIEMIIGLVAIHKSGAAYVPLDPEYPRGRIALMIDDAGANILLTHSKLKNEIPENNAKIVCIDKALQKQSETIVENCSGDVTSSDLAYVIYTSGSTGKPKGVMVEHRNVLNFFEGMDDTLGYDGQPGVWLAVTSISFDISVLEIFWSLSRGFKVIVQEEEARTFGVETQTVSKVDREMGVGLFYFSSDAGPDVHGDRYRVLMEGAKFADANGFSTVWTPERHFHLFGGVYPNPSVTSAAIAAITKNVAIRAGSIVLPLHNPIRIAEEWSVVDNLSNGRIGFSFASGWHANDFALMPDNFEDRKQIMFDGIETIKKLWRGETVDVVNGEGNTFGAKIYPAPIQAEPPVWITTAGNVETFRQAGEGGFNILTNLLGQSIEGLAEKIAAYRQGRKDKNHQGEGSVCVMVHTFIGTDVEEVKSIIREPFCNYLKTSFDLVKMAPWAFPAFSQPSKAAAQDASFDPSTFTEEDMDALIDHAFERYFESAAIFGTPTSCLPLIDQLKTAGIDEIGCLVDFGVSDDLVLDGLVHLNKLRELSNPSPNSSQGQGSEDFSIASQIKSHEVTHFQCTPSMARILMSDPKTLTALNSVRKFIIGGEALPPDVALALRHNAQGELINVYGPTETTIWSTSGQISGAKKDITIGRPIANTRIYILDSALQPVPIGAPGELMIGGKGVVRGYLNREELTADRFIVNPFEIPDDPRIYRTGDLVKYQENGEIEFLGRLDNQVKLRGYRIELGEIESLINTHSGIRDSVITAPISDDGIQSLVAYIVPHIKSTNQSTGHWQTLWDEAYQGNIAGQEKASSPVADPVFNTSGWLNSYTGLQYADEHMKEWVDATVERVLDCKPERVLEIGCGTGLILYRVAPKCDAYVGVDFSESALTMIKTQIDDMQISNVSLVQGDADSLDLEGEELFDLVIINSVAQYFPSADYFISVLKNATKLLTPTGKIFVGDVRSLPLKNTFYSTVELANAPASLATVEVQNRVNERAERESELLVDPDFFLLLTQEIPAIASANVQLKRGRHLNEMSAYRYDVVLNLDADFELLDADEFQLAPSVETISELEGVVSSNSGNIVVRDLLNARLSRDFFSEKQLKSGELHTVSDIHNSAEESILEAELGIEPEAIYQLKTQHQVELAWASSGKKDCFDAYFYTGDCSARIQLAIPKGGSSMSSLCEEPKQQSSHYELEESVRGLLRSKLPEFMVPSEFVTLSTMPLTPNGKINRKALPKPEKRQRVVEEEFVAPASDIEQTIAIVFQEMLNLEKIGTKDNFFSMGANSLLVAQANNHLNQRLDQHVSLVAMYRFPTVASLAEHIAGDTDNSQSSTKGTERAEKRKAALGSRRKRMAKRR